MDPENWMVSSVITGHFITSLRVQEGFRTAEQSEFLREGREEVQRRNASKSDEALTETLEVAPVQIARRLPRVTKISVWLKVHPYKVNGTELGAQKLLNALFLQYGLDLPDLPKLCDGCNAALSI